MNNKINHRKIWVTGSRGFIGTHLVPELENICELKCLSNTKSEKTSFNDESNKPIYVDFQSERSVNKAVERIGLPDIFIHLRWGDMANPHSEMHIGANVSQSKNLIKVLYEAGLDKFVFLGSMNEYGNRLGPLYEDMGPEGWITNYARGKIEVAKFGFEKAKEFGKKFIHIRLFYTLRYVQSEDTLIQDLYHGFKKNTVIPLGPCEHYRDYIHVSDAVKGIRLLSNINESTTVNLGSGRAIRLKEFVILFWKILGGNPEMLQFGKKQVKKEQPQPNCFANLDKLQRLTGWKPSVPIDEGIRLTIRELDKRYYNEYNPNSQKIV